ncbi:ABC transporter ATP-binding protein [bacterium]|nr:ABC transporter ATP-binding protein [bacterium]
MPKQEIILEVKNLVTTFKTDQGVLKAVDGVSFQVGKGKTLGIVGESGCGKSVTALSVLRLLPKPSGKIESGNIIFDGINLTQYPADQMRRIRGNRISMIFQEPMTALNPVHYIGKQIQEVYLLHHPERSLSRVYADSIELLKKIGIPEPEQRFNDYPHQLSGGMRQRIMIAIALACGPEILIADEPTTALDVTIQAQILDLMKSLQKESGMSIVLITHDLGVIAETCDDVIVMYAGQIVESASVIDLFRSPRHPYTKGLLNSIPRLDTPNKQILKTIEGMVPDLRDLPSGCRFQNRCSFATAECSRQAPLIEPAGENHSVACYHWKEIKN